MMVTINQRRALSHPFHCKNPSIVPVFEIFNQMYFASQISLPQTTNLMGDARRFLLIPK